MAKLGSFGSVIVCDDIRREISNKDIIIGVYSAEIIVTELPAITALGFYIEYSPAEYGAQKLFLRITVPSAAPPSVAAIDMDVPKERVGMSLALPIGAIPFHFEREGELLLEASADRKKWRVIKRKPVVKGIVSLLTPAPPRSKPGNL